MLIKQLVSFSNDRLVITYYHHFARRSENLVAIATYLNLVPPSERLYLENWVRTDQEFLLELLVSIYSAVHFTSPVILWLISLNGYYFVGLSS